MSLLFCKWADQEEEELEEEEVQEEEESGELSTEDTKVETEDETEYIDVIDNGDNDKDTNDDQINKQANSKRSTENETTKKTGNNPFLLFKWHDETQEEEDDIEERDGNQTPEEELARPRFFSFKEAEVTGVSDEPHPPPSPFNNESPLSPPEHKLPPSPFNNESPLSPPENKLPPSSTADELSSFCDYPPDEEEPLELEGVNCLTITAVQTVTEGFNMPYEDAGEDTSKVPGKKEKNGYKEKKGPRRAPPKVVKKSVNVNSLKKPVISKPSLNKAPNARKLAMVQEKINNKGKVQKDEKSTPLKNIKQSEKKLSGKKPIENIIKKPTSKKNQLKVTPDKSSKDTLAEKKSLAKKTIPEKKPAAKEIIPVKKDPPRKRGRPGKKDINSDKTEPEKKSSLKLKQSDAEEKKNSTAKKKPTEKDDITVKEPPEKKRKTTRKASGKVSCQEETVLPAASKRTSRTSSRKPSAKDNPKEEEITRLPVIKQEPCSDTFEVEDNLFRLQTEGSDPDTWTSLLRGVSLAEVKVEPETEPEPKPEPVPDLERVHEPDPEPVPVLEPFHEPDPDPYHDFVDPLGDPLSLSGPSEPLPVSQPSSWPRPDPLFESVHQFRLPRMARQKKKPVAKVRPIVQEPQPEIQREPNIDPRIDPRAKKRRTSTEPSIATKLRKEEVIGEAMNVDVMKVDQQIKEKSKKDTVVSAESKIKEKNKEISKKNVATKEIIPKLEANSRRNKRGMTTLIEDSKEKEIRKEAKKSEETTVINKETIAVRVDSKRNELIKEDIAAGGSSKGRETRKRNKRCLVSSESSEEKKTMDERVKKDESMSDDSKKKLAHKKNNDILSKKEPTNDAKPVVAEDTIVKPRLLRKTQQNTVNSIKSSIEPAPSPPPQPATGKRATSSRLLARKPAEIPSPSTTLTASAPVPPPRPARPKRSAPAPKPAPVPRSAPAPKPAPAPRSVPTPKPASAPRPTTQPRPAQGLRAAQTETAAPTSAPHPTRPKRSAPVPKPAPVPRPAPAPRPAPVPRIVPDPYQPVCKAGTYQCPLCFTRWSLNQTYGRHIVSQSCQSELRIQPSALTPWLLGEEQLDDDLQVVEESVKPPKKVFITVCAATTTSESYVEASSVPPLRLLSRGACPTPPPALCVKEGLEYYHSLVWPDQCKEEVIFDFLANTAQFRFVSGVKGYEKLCREPLKVALFLEKKIRLSREKAGTSHRRTLGWLAKYRLFLGLPLHDLFLFAREEMSGHRVLEYPGLKAINTVGLLCLACPNANCSGCLPPKPTLPTMNGGKKRKSSLKKPHSKVSVVRHISTGKSKSKSRSAPRKEKDNHKGNDASNYVAKQPPPKQSAEPTVQAKNMTVLRKEEDTHKGNDASNNVSDQPPPKHSAELTVPPLRIKIPPSTARH